MSVHVEWTSAVACHIEVVKPDTWIGDDTTSDHALVLGTDSLLVIEGTPEELVALAETILSRCARAVEDKED